MQNDELSQLEELLSADVCVNYVENHKESLCEINLFKNETNVKDKSDNEHYKRSAIHEGETDSSDDEERRNCMDRKYNDYGTQIKKALDNEENERRNRTVEFETRLRETNNYAKSEVKNKFITKADTSNTKEEKKMCMLNTKEKKHLDVLTDPFFGIRITKPLISNASLIERMKGKETINMFRLKRHVEHGDLSLDWVIAGVIIKKSASKKSQKGSQFMIWTLSDLKDDIKTVSLFLFRKAYNELWKTSEGTVVAILNANVLDRSENSRDQACLSIDSADRVMILGQSKDLGVCRSKKKNGEPCTSVINTSQGDHCIYHVKQEYQKFARRQELQSSTMGKGLLNLQNKLLGKSTVIYGGKSYSAVPIKTNNKLTKQDQNRLMSLSDFYKSENEKLITNKSPMGAGSLLSNSTILHSPSVQRKTDRERLNSLSSRKTEIKEQQNVTLGKKTNQFSKGHRTEKLTLGEKVTNSPKLSSGFGLTGGGIIDLSISYGQKASERAKANAIRFIVQNGGIPKSDPNNIKGTTAGKKRALEKLNNSGSENPCKKVKADEIRPKTIMSERFKKILEATSAHQNLINQHEDEEQEKYFSKLEKKEAMEEKMLNTFKLACKAVRCVKCKYTSFSAAQLCKDECHPLKVLDTYKRFFKCSQCGNRTVSLEIIPLHSCNNCKSSKWEKAPMMKEKKITRLSDDLSIRGEEETYIGSTVSGKNINLLVPDS